VLDKAKAGNEMAAVQIAEWNNLCRPNNSTEKKVLLKIKQASEEIFV
jgi:hypothetical protein